MKIFKNKVTNWPYNAMKVPLGSKYVEIPGTTSSENPRGLMVEVYWEQDNHGNLCISGHSNEIPVPPGLQLTT